MNGDPLIRFPGADNQFMGFRCPKDHDISRFQGIGDAFHQIGTISRDEYRTLDREIEKLDELLDSAFDRLEITYGIDD